MASPAALPRGGKAYATTVVTSYLAMVPGDHICLSWNWGDYYRYRHMVVVDVDALRRRAKVIHYHSSSKSKDLRKPPHTVIETWEPIDPEEDKVWRYEYDEDACFSTEQVLRNARQCLGKKRPELKNIISPNFCKLVSNSSRRFAEWCKTGKGWDFVNPAPPGDIPEHCGADDLGMTCIKSVSELDVADHVALVDKYGGLTHGLVDHIYLKKGHIHVVTYNVKDDRKPQSVQLVTWYFGSKKYVEVYRYKYGTNQCVGSGNALQRAHRHLERGADDLGNIVPNITKCTDWSLMSLYFVRWCKVGQGWAYEPVVETPLYDLSELQRGDHLAIKRAGGMYSHHVIIEDVKGEGKSLEINIIHNTKISELQDKKSVIEITKQTLTKEQTYLDFNSGVVHRVNYHPNDCLDTADVIARARSLVGRRNYHLASFNCEHFARWCKTGKEKSLQVAEIFKTVSQGVFALSERFWSAMAASALNEILDISYNVLIGQALIIGGELFAFMYIVKKEYDHFERFKTDHENLLRRGDISQEIFDHELRKYKVQATTRMGGVIIGMIIGEIVQFFLPVPVIRNIVSMLIAGAGFFLGHGLGFLVNILIDKIVVALPKIKSRINEIFHDVAPGLSKLLTLIVTVFSQCPSSDKCLTSGNQQSSNLGYHPVSTSF